MDISQFVTVVGDKAELIIPVRKYFKTDGLGHWSTVSKKVYVRSIEMTIGLVKDEDDYYGSTDMRVYFSRGSWDTRVYGLIYTDVTFKKYLHEFLVGLGFDSAAVYDVHYSEQGMQGSLHVSCDAYDFEEYMRKNIIQISGRDI
jgi:hypothetical protein